METYARLKKTAAAERYDIKCCADCVVLILSIYKQQDTHIMIMTIDKNIKQRNDYRANNKVKDKVLRGESKRDSVYHEHLIPRE